MNAGFKTSASVEVKAVALEAVVVWAEATRRRARMHQRLHAASNARLCLGSKQRCQPHNIQQMTREYQSLTAHTCACFTAEAGWAIEAVGALAVCSSSETFTGAWSRAAATSRRVQWTAQLVLGKIKAVSANL